MDTVNIFWTGGWDSTFRILQLAEHDIIIQPWYIIDPVRIGNKYEQRAMDEILATIETSSEFKARILPIKKINAKEIDAIEDEEIASAYNRLKEKYKLGWQYQWFAKLCKNMPGETVRKPTD